MDRKERNRDIFRGAGYGLMMHFGLYSMLGGSWNGRKGPTYAEWTECFLEIPNSEMEKIREHFDPWCFDAEKICSLCEKAGMKYIVITAKHHEGFALWDSKADDFNVMHTPLKRDMLKELAESCRRHGLKLGFYYSQVIDWHEENGGGYLSDPAGAAGPSWNNSWDFPGKEGKDYGITFRRKILPQVKELLTGYGDVLLMWFDMPLDCTEEQSNELYGLVKSLQPDCLVNSRLGHGACDYVTFGDNVIPDEIPVADGEADPNDIWGNLISEDGLYESAGTLNDSWGWSPSDHNWKSPETVAMNRLKLERMGMNYLLNVGPDWLGRIPVEAEEILIEAGSIYEKLKEEN